jgi:hypothetical protein
LSLNEYYNRWLKLSDRQREFVLAVLASQKFSLAEVAALIDEWVVDMEYLIEEKYLDKPEEPEVP